MRLSCGAALAAAVLAAADTQGVPGSKWGDDREMHPPPFFPKSKPDVVFRPTPTTLEVVRRGTAWPTLPTLDSEVEIDPSKAR